MLALRMSSLLRLCMYGACSPWHLETPALRQASQAALYHALQDADLLTTAIQEFGAEYPSLVGPFLSERDQYMVCTLRMLASR